MTIDLYTDYACPFCLIQREIIRKLDCEALFVPRFMEIHPQVPPEGSALESLASESYAERINAQLEEYGRPLGIQPRLGGAVFSSRRAIVLRAFLRARCSREAVDAYDTRLYRAYNVEGENFVEYQHGRQDEGEEERAFQRVPIHPPQPPQGGQEQGRRRRGEPHHNDQKGGVALDHLGQRIGQPPQHRRGQQGARGQELAVGGAPSLQFIHDGSLLSSQ